MSSVRKGHSLGVARRGRASLADGPQAHREGGHPTREKPSPAHPSQMSQGCSSQGVEDQPLCY